MYRNMKQKLSEATAVRLLQMPDWKHCLAIAMAWAYRDRISYNVGQDTYRTCLPTADSLRKEHLNHDSDFVEVTVSPMELSHSLNSKSKDRKGTSRWIVFGTKSRYPRVGGVIFLPEDIATLFTYHQLNFFPGDNRIHALKTFRSFLMDDLEDADKNSILHAFRPNLRSHDKPECDDDDVDLQAEETEETQESMSEKDEDELHIAKSSASSNPVSSAMKSSERNPKARKDQTQSATAFASSDLKFSERCKQQRVNSTSASSAPLQSSKLNLQVSECLESMTADVHTMDDLRNQIRNISSVASSSVLALQDMFLNIGASRFDEVLKEVKTERKKLSALLAKAAKYFDVTSRKVYKYVRSCEVMLGRRLSFFDKRVCGLYTESF